MLARECSASVCLTGKENEEQAGGCNPEEQGMLMDRADRGFRVGREK